MLAGPAVLAQGSLEGDRLATDSGDLIVHPLGHATFVMGWDGRTVYVDPVGGAARFAGLPSPDLILVTDVHGDHMDAETLSAVAGAAPIVGPAAVVEQLPDGLTGHVLANGEQTTLLDITIEGVPMYNLTEDRLQYHAKGRGNGYVATFGGTRVYISGDTEDIPEMRGLQDIDAAFVCFNLPYTMTEEQAASAVREFAPDVVYPYHYRGSDVERFAALVGGDSGVDVRVLEWYAE
jgi:L-ascorbate metabolism protein UlaG (beta-lactamase superfamily)